MGSHAGGGGRKLNGGFSQYSLHGAAERNELKQLRPENFFQHGTESRYFDAENARRGYPVVKGSEGLEVGHMAKAHLKVDGYTFSGQGVVTKFEGDKVWIKDQGGNPRVFPKSAITHYAKDKNIRFGPAVVFKLKSSKPMNFSWGSK